MITSAVPCQITYRFTCEACGADAEVPLRCSRGDPLLPPEHYLPAGWHIFDHHTVCPLHTLILEQEP